MNSGHHIASINWCGKTFYCNYNEINECNITDTYNSSTAYILLYKLVMECQGGNMFRRTFVVVSIVECLQRDRGGWELINSHGAGTVVCPFTAGRGVDIETCGMDYVSSWRPLVWLGHLWYFVRIYILYNIGWLTVQYRLYWTKKAILDEAQPSPI